MRLKKTLCGIFCRILAITTAVLVCLTSMEQGFAQENNGIVEKSYATILFMGDSQMAGEGWPGGFQNIIEENSADISLISFNVSVGGSKLSTGDILAQWKYYLSQMDNMPDVIVLDGGANDLLYGVPADSDDPQQESASNGLRALYDAILEDCPDVRIVFMTLPPMLNLESIMWNAPDLQEQRAYWQQLMNVCMEYEQVTVLDFFSLNPFFYPSQENYAQYYMDPVHFTEAGYRLLAPYLFNTIALALQ